MSIKREMDKDVIYNHNGILCACSGAQSCLTICDPMDCSSSRFLCLDHQTEGTSDKEFKKFVMVLLPGSHYINLHLCVWVTAKSLQSCLTLCDPMDCSLPGFSLHGILQARILESVAMPSSRGSSQARNRTCVSLHLSHPHC